MHIYKRKTFVLYCFFYNIFHFNEFDTISPDCKSTSCFLCHLYWVKWSRCISFWSCFSLCSDRSGWTCLSGSKGIVFIVHYYICDIEISFTRVNKMSYSDSVSITITSCCKNCEFRVNDLYSCCKRKGSSMKCFCCISIKVLACFSTTSYSWYYYSVVWLYFEFLKGIFDSHDDEGISTSWTPLYIR